MARSALIIEDETDFAEIIAMNLRRVSFDVTTTRTGEGGLLEARRRRPDIVLLDLMLPDLSGTEVCRRLKLDPATRDIPVIMVTARGEEIDRIVGFELGVDDYVVKPVVMRELVLRVHAVLRRARQSALEEATPDLQVGPIRIDGPAHRVFVADREVFLTALEFRLLATLAANQGRVLSRETLLDRVWGIQAEIETRTVDTMMKRLRDKMEAAGNLLETVRGVGYRLRVE
ncbi:winged helix-turn-helix domain-containing protein [Myxococcota bacterium]|nr:winged helix-turn-helix domain-containing protein [Myxococcota bacterium]